MVEGVPHNTLLLLLHLVYQNIIYLKLSLRSHMHGVGGGIEIIKKINVQIKGNRKIYTEFNRGCVRN
jgi:hypothetical protein